jgi:WS/DGAT/MGAT family acyltransferase
MSQAVHHDRKMSDAEGLMWRLDKDPYLSSTFANVTILDRPPDWDRLVRRMERATIAIRRLRQRVQPMPVNLTAPIWVDDPEFDLHYHLRRIALPKPGTLRQLLDLASLVAMDPFDRTRPLWQFWIVEGLRGQKAALIEKLHHTITDGEGGVQLSLEFLDFDRDAPEPEPLDDEWIDEVVEPPMPSAAELVRDLMAGPLRLPLGLVRQVRDLLADPTAIPEAGTAATDTLRGILTQLSDVDAARSPVWTGRSLRRNLQVLRVPYHETREAAKRLGGTLNTAFLTAAAEAAGRYHDQVGHPVESLRASMAISTRTASSGANAFSLARLLVPTGPMPVAERFAAVAEAVVGAREASATASLEALAAVAAALPTSVVTRLARTQSQTVDFATSNVRGTPVPVYVAGAQLLENYPVGPLAGVAFNLTLLSHVNSLDMGMNIDIGAVSEPERLQRCLARAFRDLLAS